MAEKKVLQKISAATEFNYFQRQMFKLKAALNQDFIHSQLIGIAEARHKFSE
jgi:hypothetical protein